MLHGNQIQNLVLLMHFKKLETFCLYILFSSIQLNLEDIIKNKKSTTDNTIVEHTELVPNDSSKYNKNTNNIQQSTSTITGDKQPHPLYPKLKLIAFLLSNNTSEHKTYLIQQRKLFWLHGEQQLKTDTTQNTGNGRNSVVRETLIAFNQL